MKIHAIVTRHLAVPAAALLAFTLSSCQSVGPNYQAPTVAPASGYKGADARLGNRIERRWWRAFGDSTLNGYMADLENGNFDLKGALARRGQAFAALGIDRAELFPHSSAGGGVERSRGSDSDVGNGGQYLTRYSVAASLGYEIDLWGRVRRLVEAGTADADAASLSVEDVRLSLQSQLARSYFALRFLDNDAQVLRQALETRGETLTLATDRFEGGKTSELDVARAETELASTKAQLVALEGPRASLENAIAVLAGKHPSNFSINPTHYNRSIPSIAAGLPGDLLGRRPDVAARERQLAATSARIGVATAEFFPKVSLTGSGGLSSINSGDFLNWSSRAFAIGPDVSLPLFQGGRIKNNVELAKAQHEEALAAFQQSALNAFADVENSLASSKAARNEVAALESSVTAANKTLSLSNLQYQEGVSSYLDVVDSQREQLTAERRKVEARGRQFGATVQLIQALGGGFTR